MGIDFRRPRRIRGFGLGEVLIFGPGIGRVLVEKSASGAIASFADGADGVPVKSCVVSFLPSGGGGTPSAPVAITGVSGLSVTRTGKNLLSITPIYRKVANNPSMSSCMFVKAGTYMFSFDKITDGETEATNWRFVVTVYNTDGTINSGLTFSGLAYNSSLKAYLNNANVSVKTRELTFPTDSYIFIGFAYGSSTESMGMTQPMLEVGSTATTYSAYVTPSVVTDTFGQTIYGGTRDLTTDKAESVGKIYKFNDASLSWYYSSATQQFYTQSLNGLLYRSGEQYEPIICSIYQGVNTSATTDNTITHTVTSNTDQIRLKDTRFTDVNLWLASVGEEEFFVNLATPTEITGLTPHEIDTLYGDNNIYSNAPKSTTSVIYYADQSLIPDSSTRSLQLSHSSEVDEEVVDEEVEEGVDDMR